MASDSAFAQIMGRQPVEDQAEATVEIDGTSRNVYCAVAGVPDAWRRSYRMEETTVLQSQLDIDGLRDWHTQCQRKMFEDIAHTQRRSCWSLPMPAVPGNRAAIVPIQLQGNASAPASAQASTPQKRAPGTPVSSPATSQRFTGPSAVAVAAASAKASGEAVQVVEDVLPVPRSLTQRPDIQFRVSKNVSAWKNKNPMLDPLPSLFGDPSYVIEISDCEDEEAKPKRRKHQSQEEIWRDGIRDIFQQHESRMDELFDYGCPEYLKNNTARKQRPAYWLDCLTAQKAIAADKLQEPILANKIAEKISEWKAAKDYIEMLKHYRTGEQFKRRLSHEFGIKLDIITEKAEVRRRFCLEVITLRERIHVEKFVSESKIEMASQRMRKQTMEEHWPSFSIARMKGMHDRIADLQLDMLRTGVTQALQLGLYATGVDAKALPIVRFTVDACDGECWMTQSVQFVAMDLHQVALGQTPDGTCWPDMEASLRAVLTDERQVFADFREHQQVGVVLIERAKRFADMQKRQKEKSDTESRCRVSLARVLEAIPEIEQMLTPDQMQKEAEKHTSVESIKSLTCMTALAPFRESLLMYFEDLDKLGIDDIKSEFTKDFAEKLVGLRDRFCQLWCGVLEEHVSALFGPDPLQVERQSIIYRLRLSHATCQVAWHTVVGQGINLICNYEATQEHYKPLFEKDVIVKIGGAFVDSLTSFEEFFQRLPQVGPCTAYPKDESDIDQQSLDNVVSDAEFRGKFCAYLKAMADLFDAFGFKKEKHKRAVLAFFGPSSGKLWAEKSGAMWAQVARPIADRIFSQFKASLIAVPLTSIVSEAERWPVLSDQIVDMKRHEQDVEAHSQACAAALLYQEGSRDYIQTFNFEKKLNDFKQLSAQLLVWTAQITQPSSFLTHMDDLDGKLRPMLQDLKAMVPDSEAESRLVPTAAARAPGGFASDLTLCFQKVVSAVVVRGYLQKLHDDLSADVGCLPKNAEDALKSKSPKHIKGVFMNAASIRLEQRLHTSCTSFEAFKLHKDLQQTLASDAHFIRLFAGIPELAGKAWKFIYTIQACNIVVNKVSVSPPNVLSRLFNQFPCMLSHRLALRLVLLF